METSDRIQQDSTEGGARRLTLCSWQRCCLAAWPRSYSYQLSGLLLTLSTFACVVCWGFKRGISLQSALYSTLCKGVEVSGESLLHAAMQRAGCVVKSCVTQLGWEWDKAAAWRLGRQTLVPSLCLCSFQALNCHGTLLTLLSRTAVPLRSVSAACASVAGSRKGIFFFFFYFNQCAIESSDKDNSYTAVKVHSTVQYFCFPEQK